MPVNKICEQCGDNYTCRPSKAHERRYCGPICSRIARTIIDADTPTERKREYARRWTEKDPTNASRIKDKQFTKYYSTLKGRAKHMQNNARRRAKERGVVCSLECDWIKERLEHGVCEVTGIPFTLQKNGGKGHLTNSFSPSIDRINQNGPYSPENCRVVVWIYNRARGAFPDGDFDKMIEALRAKRVTSGFVHN